MIFTTFMLREGKRETLKNESDTLDLANQSFSMRKEEAQTRNLVVRLSGQVAQLESAKTSNPVDEVSKSTKTVNEIRQEIYLHLNNEKSSLEGIHILIGHIPANDDLKKRTTRLEEDNKHLWSSDLRLGKAQVDFLKEVFTHNQQALLHPAGASQTLRHQADQREADQSAEALNFESAFQTLLVSSRQLDAGIAKLDEDALAASESYHEQLEKSYKRYQRWSIVFYILGWLLGIVGRMSGIKLHELEE